MKYRADIDGLRAVAVLGVIGFHFGVNRLSGGFVGVDIFFVISGYLLSSIIREEINAGTFSIVGFYARRVRRIYPALVGVYLATFCFAYAFFPPDKFAAFGRTLVGAVLFFNNAVFMKTMTQAGYFDNVLDKPLLLHTWSLSVEEQFYLFIPGLLLVLCAISSRRRLLCLCAICLTSFLFSTWNVTDAPNTAFYSLFSRAWELLVGVTAAEIAGRLPGNRPVREFCGLMGLAAVIYGLTSFTVGTPFPGYNALFPVMGTSVIILAGQRHDTFLSRILSTTPLTAVGRISYSLYLWHWPVLIAINGLTLTPIAGGKLVFAVVVTFLLAVCSFRFIEEPFRRRRVLGRDRPLLAVSLVSTLVVAACGLALVLSHGVPIRFASAELEVIEANQRIASDFGWDASSCLNFQLAPRTIADVAQCPIGGSETNNKILFWGDSHVAQLHALIQDMYAGNELGGRGATFMISAGCPPILSLKMTNPTYHCDQFSRLALQRAEQADIGTVFIMFYGAYGSFWWQPGMFIEENGEKRPLASADASKAVLLNDLKTYVETLQSEGKRVVIALPQPAYDESIPNLLVLNAMMRPYGWERLAKRRDFDPLRQDLQHLAAATGAGIFDARRAFCPEGTCRYEVSGIALYRDNDHVAASLGSIYKDELARALLPPP